MAKKKRRALLPKRIAGVKVPKSVRKGRFGELLASQTGRALLAEAVLAVGAIGAVKKAGDEATDKAADTAADAAAESPSLRSFTTGVAERLQHGANKDQGAVLASALGEAARAFVSAINERRTHASAEAAPLPAPSQLPSSDDDAGGSKKKSGSDQPNLP